MGFITFIYKKNKQTNKHANRAQSRLHVKGKVHSRFCFVFLHRVIHAQA